MTTTLLIAASALLISAGGRFHSNFQDATRSSATNASTGSALPESRTGCKRCGAASNHQAPCPAVKTRAARSATFDATVAGWLQEDGKVWDINQLVQVSADAVGITGELLIAAVEYSLDADTGETTQLNLKRPDAFLPDPKEAEKAQETNDKQAKAEAKQAKAAKSGKAGKRGSAGNAIKEWEKK